MRNRRLSCIAGMALLGMLSSQAFGWSIDGIVKSKISGRLLGGVKINTFNFGGYETISAEDGTFHLSGDGTEAFHNTKASNMAIHMEGNTLTLYNADANNLKVSIIDAMGKVLKQNNVGHVQGIVTLDLGKLARGAKFIRINADHNSSTFQVTDKGVRALKKEGDLLPMLQFAMDGYANKVYQMQSEIETGVTIEMERPSSSSSGGTDPFVSSSSNTSITSSSSKTIDDTPVDCTGKTYAAGDHNMSVNVDGKNRTFIMHVPSTYTGDKPVPLFVDYHPIGGNGAGQERDTKYKQYTDKEGVIALYPDGTTNHVGRMAGSAGWNVGPCCSDDDDVKFSREMIKFVETKVCIDKKRVYAAGFSMGGGMSNHVACNMADIYAAVAPAGMDLNKDNSAKCSPARPISIIMFRGTTDFICKYQGGDSGFEDGLNFLGAENNFKFWAEKNGCTGSPTTNSDGCKEYSTCRDGVKVVLCTDKNADGNGNGHDQGNAKIGWPFLKSFTLP